MAISRLVAINDDDPVIQYPTGKWVLDSGTRDNIGNYGPSLLSSLHASDGKDASVLIPFKGTGVEAYGFADVTEYTKPPDPQWECFLDGEKKPSSSSTAFQLNNWKFCEILQLPEAAHVLEIRKTGTRPFYFDYATIVPSDDAQFDKGLVKVFASDPMFKFDKSWRELYPSVQATNVTDSAVTVSFIGRSLTWYGWIPQEYSPDFSTAAYSLDGQTPKAFALKGLTKAGDPTEFNFPFLSLTDLQQGKHELTVMYTGNGNKTPLTVSHLIISNATSNSGGGGGGNSNSPKNESPNNNKDDNKQLPSTPTPTPVPVGAIAGAICGGVAVIGLAIFLIFWRKRRQSRRQEEEAKLELAPPTLQPFNAYLQMSPNPGGSSLSVAHPPFSEKRAMTMNAHKFAGVYPSPTQGSSSQSSSSLQHSRSQPISRNLSAKQREAGVSHGEGGTHDVSPYPTQVIVHADSGIRLPSGQEQEQGQGQRQRTSPAAEAPPTYFNVHRRKE